MWTTSLPLFYKREAEVPCLFYSSKTRFLASVLPVLSVGLEKITSSLCPTVSSSENREKSMVLPQTDVVRMKYDSISNNILYKYKRVEL